MEKDHFNYYYDKPGNEPGKVFFDVSANPSNLTLIEYNKNNFYSYVDTNPENCISCLTNDLISWADIEGLGSEEILTKVAEVFNLHPLVLEDVVNIPQSPKLEDYKEQLLIILHCVKLNANQKGFFSEQFSFVLGKNYLLTFQEDKESDFDNIKKRIEINGGKARKLGADYLMYLLLDSIIDSYFPVLEHYGERIEHLEEKIILKASQKTFNDIYRIKRELLALRRFIWPLRNLFNELIKEESKLISSNVYTYLRDCYYHTIQLLEILETYRELISSLMDVQISIMSHKMNEVINLLTIISTIFIPLTFIAGVYGMNFKYMPELEWPWGYFVCLGFMLLIALILLFFFWRRGWLNFTQLSESKKPKKKKNK